ncbi:MAG: hypothetical protein GTO18_01800 [Anaerolineales bacterium]|nr:hypothetical protein [Anaerolineales bacterium]
MRSIPKFITSSLIVLIISLLGAGCTNPDTQKSTITYGLTLAPSGIDPHINASAELGIPLSSVYDTLVFQDPETGEFVPGLAEEWTISEDGLTYTFNLRQDVTFHDGSHFNADAVEANLAYILNPDHLSQKAAIMLGPFDRVEVIDEYIVSFHLHEPFAPLLDSIAQVYLGMASPDALEKWGPGEYQFHQVGTGPYRFVEYIPNDHLTLEMNPDYDWGPEIYKQSKAEIDEIIFRFYEDPATRRIAIESGEVDILGEVPPRDAQRLLEGDFHLLPIAIPGQPMQLFFNTQREPTNELQLRAALIEAIDRESIVDTIFGEHSPVATGPLSACTLGYNPNAPFPEYNPDAAAAKLDELGWLKDEDLGKRVRDGEILKLELVVPPWGSNPDAGQLISAAWEALGADVDLQVAPGFGPLKQKHDEGEFHAIGINFFGTDPDLLRSFYHSEGLYNWSGYQDLELDRLLIEGAQSSGEPSMREAIYWDISERIRDQALILPIRDYINLVVAQNQIEGLRFSSQGWFPFLIDLYLAQ